MKSIDSLKVGDRVYYYTADGRREAFNVKSIDGDFVLDFLDKRFHFRAIQGKIRKRRTWWIEVADYGPIIAVHSREVLVRSENKLVEVVEVRKRAKQQKEKI